MKESLRKKLEYFNHLSSNYCFSYLNYGNMKLWYQKIISVLFSLTIQHFFYSFFVRRLCYNFVSIITYLESTFFFQWRRNLSAYSQQILIWEVYVQATISPNLKWHRIMNSNQSVRYSFLCKKYLLCCFSANEEYVGILLIIAFLFLFSVCRQTSYHCV